MITMLGNAIDSSASFPDGTKFEGMAGLKKALLAHPEQFVGTVAEKLADVRLSDGIFSITMRRRFARSSAMRQGNNYTFCVADSGGGEEHTVSDADAQPQSCSASKCRGKNRDDVHHEKEPAAPDVFAGCRDAALALPMLDCDGSRAFGEVRAGAAPAGICVRRERRDPGSMESHDDGRGFRVDSDPEASGADSRTRSTC